MAFTIAISANEPVDPADDFGVALAEVLTAVVCMVAPVALALLWPDAVTIVVLGAALFDVGVDEVLIDDGKPLVD
jgi:hypothetical protein